MEYKQSTTLLWPTFICLLFFLVNSNYKFSFIKASGQTFLFLVNGISTNTDPEIISTQDEIITYVNHTAKLSCIIQNRNRQHVSQ